MENKKTHQVNEFKLVDDHGNEYTVFEYQEGTEKPSLKWIKAGPSLFSLSDGTAVERLDDDTFTMSESDIKAKKITARYVRTANVSVTHRATR
jgi:hypothetical protein